MRIWISIGLTIIIIMISRLSYTGTVINCDYEPKYSGAESYLYTIIWKKWQYDDTSYGYEFHLNESLLEKGTYSVSQYEHFDEDSGYWYIEAYYDIPAKYHKVGQNTYYFRLLGLYDSWCIRNGPYIYDYITPTPSLTATPSLTPTSTPLPMTEKCIPYWEVNHGKMRDTFFSVSSSADIYMEGAFEFYDNNGDTVGSVPLTLAPHGMQTLTADHAIFSQKAESSPAGGYYGYAKVMAMGGDFEVFGAVYRANVGIEYTLSTMEPMTSPIRIPLFQVAEGLSDTLLYLTNPTEKTIDDVGIKLYANNGEKVAYFNITLSPHKMKERALSIHIDPSIKSVYGSCILEWDADAEIMLFPLVRYNNTDRYFRVEAK